MSDVRRRFEGLQREGHRPSVVLVGCGGIGSWVAKWVARMGFPLWLVDFDHVEEQNIGTQGYGVEDLETAKVDALAGQLHMELGEDCPQLKPFNGSVESFTMLGALWPQDPESVVVVAALDSIPARRATHGLAKRLADKYGDEVLLIDPRMSLKEVEMHTVVVGPSFAPETEWEAEYLKTCFPDEPDTDPCTARATPYTGGMAAAMVCEMVMRWSQLSQESDMDIHEGSCYGDMGAMSLEVWTEANKREATG